MDTDVTCANCCFSAADRRAKPLVAMCGDRASSGGKAHTSFLCRQRARYCIRLNLSAYFQAKKAARNPTETEQIRRGKTNSACFETPSIKWNFFSFLFFFFSSFQFFRKKAEQRKDANFSSAEPTEQRLSNSVMAVSTSYPLSITYSTRTVQQRGVAPMGNAHKLCRSMMHRSGRRVVTTFRLSLRANRLFGQRWL